MNKLIGCIALLLASSWGYAANSIKAEVNGMVCAFCAKGIEKKLNALPEKQAVFVDLKNRIVVLEVKDGLTLPIETFTQVIEDAGYSVTKVEQVARSVADIKADIAQQKGGQ
jgi:copper chaperone CopZ